MLRRLMMAGGGGPGPTPGGDVSILSVARTNYFTASTSKSIPMPATVAADDMLLITLYCLASEEASFSTPTGWTREFTQSDGGGSGFALVVYSRIADGSEGGMHVDITSASSTKASANVSHLQGATVLDVAGGNWFNTSTQATPVPAGTWSGGTAVLTEIHSFYDPTVSAWALPNNQERSAGDGSNQTFIASTGTSAAGLPTIGDYTLSRTVYAAHVTIVAS